MSANIPLNSLGFFTTHVLWSIFTLQFFLFFYHFSQCYIKLVSPYFQLSFVSKKKKLNKGSFTSKFPATSCNHILLNVT